MARIPDRNHVTPEGNISFTGVSSTEFAEYPEKMTDLKDVDYSQLRNAKPGEIWLLAYIPNKEKRFGFIKVADPRVK